MKFLEVLAEVAEDPKSKRSVVHHFLARTRQELCFFIYGRCHCLHYFSTFRLVPNSELLLQSIQNILADILLHSLSPEQTKRTDANSCALLKVGTAKANPIGSHCAPFPVYLPYHGAEELNAARSIRDLDQVMQA